MASLWYAAWLVSTGEQSYRGHIKDPVHLKIFSCSNLYDPGSLSNFCLFLLIAVHLRPKHMHNKSLQMFLEGQLKVELHTGGVLEVVPEWQRLVSIAQSV